MAANTKATTPGTTCVAEFPVELVGAGVLELEPVELELEGAVPEEEEEELLEVMGAAALHVMENCVLPVLPMPLSTPQELLEAPVKVCEIVVLHDNVPT